LEEGLTDLNADITALLGDPEAGWEMLTPLLESDIRYSPNFLKIHPFYQYVYGDVSGYQAYIAQVK
jgi:hypothetical protein